jgi:hypothetical protein
MEICVYLVVFFTFFVGLLMHGLDRLGESIPWQQYNRAASFAGGTALLYLGGGLLPTLLSIGWLTHLLLFLYL